MLSKRTRALKSALIAAGILVAFIAVAAVASAGEAAKDAKLPAEATCPVTGEKFKPDKDTATAEYKGTTYYFCCPGCKPQFLADPDKFVKDPRKDEKKDGKKDGKKDAK